jgi:F-type H+-transporting ATPase subunit epsilon
MQQQPRMNLKILLPFRVYAEHTGVTRIVADTHQGSFGILPHRMDCIAALASGILVYETGSEGEAYLAVDEGILIKTGFEVVVAVRSAIGGVGLEALHQAVDREFKNLDEHEQNVRSVLFRMESTFIRRMVGYSHE